MSGRARGTGTYQVADYVAIFRRGWWLLVVCAVLGMTLALLASRMAGPKYRSSTLIQVTPTGAPDNTSVANARTSGSVNLDNEAQLLRSNAVASRAAELLGQGVTPGAAVARVSVTVPPNSQILTLTYTAASSLRAQQGAGAFAQSYLESRAATARALIDGQIAATQTQLASYSAQLRDVTGKATTLPGNSPDRSFALAQQDVLTRQLTTLNSQLVNLQTVQVTPGQIISAANRPASRTGTGPLVTLASGLVAGLFLGLLAALARQRYDRRVRHNDDVTHVVDLPVMTVPAGNNAGRVLRPAGTAPAGLEPEAVAYQRLANVVAATASGSSMVLLVAPVSGGEAASHVAGGLTVALADTSLAVTLVDAGRATPAEDSTAPGLSEVLAGGTALDVAVQRVPGTTRRLLGAGSDPDAASVVRHLGSVASVLAQLRKEASVVVVQAAAMDTSPDAQALSSICDHVLLVVQAGWSRRQDLVDAVTQLEDVSAQVLGCVVVEQPGRRTRGRPPQHPDEGGFAAALRLDAERGAEARRGRAYDLPSQAGGATPGAGPSWLPGPDTSGAGPAVTAGRSSRQRRNREP